jgi:1,4-alpha-glucan branching enzyme
MGRFGVWSVTAPVPLGHHRYSFVVDDSVWVADPTAARVTDYDYGMPNSAIVVQEQK